MPRGSSLSPEEKAAKLEEKKAKFKELAEKRVTAALSAIAKIGNLSSANYSSTPEQVEKIVLTLHKAVDDVDKMFDSSVPSGPSFEL